MKTQLNKFLFVIGILAILSSIYLFFIGEHDSMTYLSFISGLSLLGGAYNKVPTA